MNEAKTETVLPHRRRRSASRGQSAAPRVGSLGWSTSVASRFCLPLLAGLISSFANRRPSSLEVASAANARTALSRTARGRYTAAHRRSVGGGRVGNSRRMHAPRTWNR